MRWELTSPRRIAPPRAAWRRERITYQDAENGFTVARLAPERPESESETARGDDRLVTVMDTLADLTPGSPHHGLHVPTNDSYA